MKQRASIFYKEHRQWVRLALGFGLFGGLYALFTTLTGIGIPCPLHLLTGLSCPGCGVSRFFLALLRGSVREAVSQNLGVAILLPLWLAVAFVEFWANPKALEEGSPLNRGLVWFSLILMVAFGILRNLPGFSFLLPS
jgi:hypothetical protein